MMKTPEIRVWRNADAAMIASVFCNVIECANDTESSVSVLVKDLPVFFEGVVASNPNASMIIPVVNGKTKHIFVSIAEDVQKRYGTGTHCVEIKIDHLPAFIKGVYWKYADFECQEKKP